MCVCWGMVKVVTFLLKLKGLGLDISRVYGYPCNRRGIEKKMHRKEVFSFDQFLWWFVIINLSPTMGVRGRCGSKRLAWRYRPN